VKLGHAVFVTCKLTDIPPYRHADCSTVHPSREGTK